MADKIRWEAAKVAGAYAVFGALWILFSDRVLLWLVKDPVRLTELQTYKGWFYVAVTALFLYAWVGRSLKHLRRSETQAGERRRLEALGRLAVGIAHDFNRVLNDQSAALELLELELGPAHPAAIRLKALRTAGQRGRALTHRLRHYLAGRSLQPVALDAATVLRGAEGLLRGLLQPGQRLELDVAPSPTLVDPRALDQVLMNLVKNAAEASPADGLVRVVCRPLPDGTELRVEDSGPGIELERLSRIFEPFYSTKGHHGLGLGLATVKSVVEELKGRVEVTAHPGGGSVFRVTLPAPSGSTV
jgi:signal transduction histidine kinase